MTVEADKLKVPVTIKTGNAVRSFDGSEGIEFPLDETGAVENVVGIDKIVVVSEAQYNALAKNPATLYIIP